MQAIILAGGKGTRLKPYTTVFPKPLMPIGENPILEIIIKRLKNHNFNNIVIAVGHLSELIQTFFTDGEKWGLNISYSFEDKPLGTAGPLKLIKSLNNDFLVMNGDGLTDINYSDLMDYHKKNGALCTIAMFNNATKIESGVLKFNKNNEITSYIEKPTIYHYFSMGIYAFKKEILDYIPETGYYDFPDLIKKLIAHKQKVMGYKFNGYWLDIGITKDYEKAVEMYEKDSFFFL